MKQLPLSVVLACSAALTACGGAQDGNTAQEKTLASTSTVVVGTGATSQTVADAAAFAPRGYPEDRAGYQPLEAGSSATAGN